MTRRRHLLVLVLTFVTGCADAIGFLVLGAFSSVMTGNMVLFGLSIGSGDGSLATTSATGVVSYVVGVLVGARVAGSSQAGDSVWPPGVTRALLVELGLVVGFAVGWEVVPDEHLVLLALAGLVMGIQSSAVQRFGVPGLSSTYMTGTLTTLIGNLAARKPWASVRPSAQILVTLVVGAVAGALVTDHAFRLAPLLLLVPLAAVVALAPRPPGRTDLAARTL